MGTKRTIRAFREIGKSELFFRQDDKELKNITSDTILKNKSDNSEIIILEIDKKTKFTKTLRIIDEKISNIPVVCIRAIYKKHENKPSTYNVYNTQNVNVAEGATTGGITQVVYIEKLNEIENAINSFKPSIFQKSKKDEAIKLYGNFKDCIIHKQKDEKLFDKFLKVLGVILPSMVQVATALIACI